MANAITDSEFEAQVLQSSKPVLIDFWAEWCVPCKAMSPVIDSLAEELGDQVDVRKLNIDENRETPAKYGIRGIPTLLLFKDGQLASSKVGGLSQAQIESWVKENI